MALPPGAPDPLQKPLHERCSLNQPFWGVVTLEEFKTVPTHQHFRRVYLHEGPNAVVGLTTDVKHNDDDETYTEKVYLHLQDGSLGEQLSTHTYRQWEAAPALERLNVVEPNGRRFLAFPPGH